MDTLDQLQSWGRLKWRQFARFVNAVEAEMIREASLTPSDDPQDPFDPIFDVAGNPRPRSGEIQGAYAAPQNSHDPWNL